MYNTASELYNDLLGIYFDEYYELSDAKRNKMKYKYDPKKLFLETYNNYNVLFENEELSNTLRKSDKQESFDKKPTDLPPMPQLEGDEEEVNEGKGLKILTLNKLLTKLSISLA